MARRSFGYVLFGTGLVMLSACSGGGGSSPAPQSQTPPPSASSNPPSISLQGENQVVHQQFAVYEDPGASATDDVDGDVEVTVSGAVDVNVIDRYVLTYSASDSDGNETSSTRVVDVVGESVFPFYTETADRFALNQTYTNSVDTFVYASDSINDGDYFEARNLVTEIFSQQPIADSVWRLGVGSQELNNGDPTAYYGMRMLDEISKTGAATPTADNLRMTAVIAPCADVVRPTDPTDLSQDEYVRLDIDPAILADDFALLFKVTEVFRQWVQSITGGSEIILEPYVLEDCAFVSYFVGGLDFGIPAIFSYPDTYTMLLGVPEDITEQTDIWWLIAPSGVPGDGSDYSSQFVTGGMGTDDFGNALFISDDAWFIRKPAHLGQGPYSEVEQRTYFPQWFQHEYMHHIYREWPEFGLEAVGHQWFDRSTWPSDFEGQFEADYYSESIDKRLSTATPSLREGLKRKPPAAP